MAARSGRGAVSGEFWGAHVDGADCACKPTKLQTIHTQNGVLYVGWQLQHNAPRVVLEAAHPATEDEIKILHEKGMYHD